MTPIVVCDASALVDGLADDGDDGRRVRDRLRDSVLLGPQLVVFETANVLRRLAAAQLVSVEQAEQAHRVLLELDIELWPYDEIAERVWELRHDLTVYDASYVAVAELAGATLVTLDARLAGAPGLRCPVVTP